MLAGTIMPSEPSTPHGDRTADVVVVGLGVMGAAAALFLARRGLSVVGLDRFRPPHTLGSSSGETRAIREAYFEHPLYVPLVQRAYDLWADLGEEVGEPTIETTGAVMIGPRDGDLVSGSLASAEEHGLDCDLLEPDELLRRFPMFTPPAGSWGLYERRAGLLGPERSVEMFLDLAERSGAELRFDEPMLDWSADDRSVRVHSERGSYSAAHVVLAGGAWMTRWLPEQPLAAERVMQHWFEPVGPASEVAPGRLPIFIFDFGGERYCYGFPGSEEGVKAALHYQGQIVDPDEVDRVVTEAEVAVVRDLLKRHLPPAAGRCLRSQVCLYTNTPDGHFLVDRHPDSARVVALSPCSGHGFKFAPRARRSDRRPGHRRRQPLRPRALRLARLAGRGE